jgi:predicted GNAT family acetyltransferase
VAEPKGISIERSEDGSHGAYRALVDGHSAEMTFSRAGEQLIIIDHTEVPEALRGRGVGQALVLRAVEDARRNGVKIFPLCPFAAAQFRRHSEYQDVLSR